MHRTEGWSDLRCMCIDCQAGALMKRPDLVEQLDGLDALAAQEHAGHARQPVLAQQIQRLASQRGRRAQGHTPAGVKTEMTGQDRPRGRKHGANILIRSG